MNSVRIFIILAVLLIGGIMLTVSGVSDMIKLNGHVPDFNFESMADIEKNDIVAGYIYNIYDCYAGETTTNTTMGIETSSYTSREYFIMPLVNDTDLDNDMFISVSVSKEADRELMYKISDATYEYLSGSEDVQFPEMEFIAKAQPMDDELMGYMLDWFEETEYFEGGRNEARQHIIPYDLVMYNPSGANTGLIAGLIMIGIDAVIVIFIIRKRKKDDQQSYGAMSPDLNGYGGGNAAAGGQNMPDGSDQTAPGNGFAESSYAPSSVPMVNLTQPADADEFFARPARKPKTEQNVPQKAPEAPKPAPSPKPEDHSNEINTDSLDTEKALYEQEQTVAANKKPVQGSEEIPTDTLDTDKALYEQEQEVAAHKKPVQGSEEIPTDTLDTEKALYEQEQAVAANKKPVQGSEEIPTDSLDTEKALYEQEQEVAAHKKQVEGSEEIDTSSLDMSELGFFDPAANGEGDDDIFDFTNDLDYDVGDGSDIEVT